MGSRDVGAQARPTPARARQPDRDPRLQQDPARQLREEGSRHRPDRGQVAVVRLAGDRDRRPRHRADHEGARSGRGDHRHSDLHRGAHREGQGRLVHGERPGVARQGAQALRGDQSDPRGARDQRERLGRVPQDRCVDARDRRRARGVGEKVMPAKASRAAFGEALIELAATDERIVTLDADLSKSTMTAGFAKKFPARALNLGIAESNMIGVGAGLALAGKVPFVCSFACFVVGRFETIRISVAYTGANVKIVGTHAGIAIGEDGYSQMGLEDIASLRALPNVSIVQPADELETKQVIAWAAEHQGPVYLRLTRQNLEPVSPPDYTFRFGKWQTLRRGHDVTLIASGGPVFNTLEAAALLANDGISADVINAACIKPLDEDMLLRSAGKTGHVVTVEDHAIAGGLGGAVAELLTDVMPTPLRRLGVTGFGESGDPKGL